MIAVPVGSNEELLVEITDYRGQLTDLSGNGPKFDLTDDAEPANYILGDGTYANAEAATASGMVIAALIDHAGFTPGMYALYVWFQDGSQNVRRGPHWYKVV